MKIKYLLAAPVAFAFCVGLFADASAGDPPASPPRGGDRTPPPPPPSPEQRGSDYWFWRAFSRLTEEERQELLKLQVSDAEQFHEKMRELGQALREEEKAGFEALLKLVEQYRAASDEKEKAALKQEIVERIRRHYMERLEDNKRRLEEMKHRTARLEDELRKREANAEDVIQTRAEGLIRGEKPSSGKRRPKAER